MAQYIPNQPVYFGEQDTCASDEYEYNQLVDNGDSTQFQLKIDKCEAAENIITNSEFDTDLTGWTLFGPWYWSSGKLSFDAGGSTLGGSAIFTTSGIIVDKYYTVELDVYSISGGSLTVYVGTEVAGVLYYPGKYKFFSKCVGFGGVGVKTESDDVAVKVDSVKVYNVATDFIVAIYKSDGSFVGELTPSQQPEQFVFFKNTLTVTVYWQDFEAENGCYYLCVLDPCINSNGQNYPAKIQNCSFDTNSVWEYDYWTYVSGYYQTNVSVSTSGNGNKVKQSGVFDNFQSDYHITVDVEITGTAKLDVKFGTNLIQTIDSTGVYNIIGKAKDDYYLQFEARYSTGTGIIKLKSACNAKVIYGNVKIVNGSFDSDLSNWEGTWLIDNPSPGIKDAYATVDSTNTTKDLIQRNVFDSVNKEYGIRVTALIPPSGRAVLDVYYGANLVKTITFTSPVGYKTFDIYGYPSGNLDLKFTTRYVSSSGDTVYISDIQPIIRDSQYDCDFVSNTFKIGDYSKDCTLLINACNDDDGMGFVFGGSGFNPRIRINAKLKQPKYDGTKDIYDDSKGNRKNVFYKRRKSKLLTTDLEPEYVHDFLSTLVGYDKFYVNGVTYVCDDKEYNVEYPDEMDYHGKVRLLIGEKIQDIKNINYTGAENNCAVTDSLLVRADDHDSLVTQTDGAGIRING